MITDNEKFIEVQGILTLSELSPNNCVKINELILELSKENQELKKQLEIGEQQYNDLVEEKEKLDAENQALKDYKNVALTYMKNYLKMELNYQNKDVAEHFKMVIDMLNRGNKHGNLVDITDCETQQKEFIKYLEDKIYSIEPKGTGIIYNCEHDSEDDYVMAMREQSRLNTLKEILLKYKKIIGNDINVGSKGVKDE